MDRFRHLGAGGMRPKVNGVAVEYDGMVKFGRRNIKDGSRKVKQFPGNGAARAFYARMLKADRNPKVVSADVGPSY